MLHLESASESLRQASLQAWRIAPQGALGSAEEGGGGWGGGGGFGTLLWIEIGHMSISLQTGCFATIDSAAFRMVSRMCDHLSGYRNRGERQSRSWVLADFMRELTFMMEI